MKLDFTEIVNRLKMLEKDFNASDDPIRRYALIQAINHVGEVEIPIHGYWEDMYRKAMVAATLKTDPDKLKKKG